MSLSALRLKPLEEPYLNAVVALDKLCLGGLWTWDGYHRELTSPNSELLMLSIPLPEANGSYPTSYQDELIIGIGCFWAILEEAHITVLGIHPDYQGQGLGQLLLTNLLNLARARDLERATLEVRQSNQVALSLYQKFGFKAAGKRKKYYQNPEEDAIVLWLGNLHQPEFEQKLAQWQKQLSQRLANYWSSVMS